MSQNQKLVSVESPYNAYTPWTQKRNIQYAILANTHAASFRDLQEDNSLIPDQGSGTYIPHICNTQVVKYGYNFYIGDTFGELLLSIFGSDQYKYNVSREDTLRITNNVRQQKVDEVILYTDLGVSSGMKTAIKAAEEKGIPVIERKLPPDLMKEVIGQSFSSTIFPLFGYTVSYGCIGYTFYNLAKKIFRFGRRL